MAAYPEEPTTIGNLYDTSAAGLGNAVDYNTASAGHINYSEKLAKLAAYETQVSNGRETLLMRVKREKIEAEREVRRTEELITLLEAHPDTERILHLLGRL
jgi:hypothetical protein